MLRLLSFWFFAFTFMVSLPSFAQTSNATDTASAVTSESGSKPDKAVLIRRKMMEEEDVNEEQSEFQTQYGFGFQYSYNYIPEWALHIALRAAHEVKSGSYGARFVIRKKNFDIVFKGIYWNINPPDGNWLGLNHNWDDMDYVEFKNLSLTYAEISAVWNSKIVDNVYFIYGGGIGGGYVGGDIYTTPAYGCTADNWRNDNTNNIGCFHSPNDPNREKEDIPRGMGLLEVTMGLRVDLTKNITAKFETGVLLPGFFYGTASMEFLF